ncbi:MAG: thermonuclease family protein [Desulfobacterales bacterium]|jgi:endonuclease YncB( thermonuclease family)
MRRKGKKVDWTWGWLGGCVWLGLSLLGTSASWAAEPPFEACCIQVIDGDTFIIRTADHTEQRVRLHGVDSPEIDQPFGLKARQFTAQHLLDQWVTLQRVTEDAQQVPLVKVFISDTLFNHTIVAAGYAWRYTRYLSSPQIAVLEHQARKSRQGLWLEPHPTPPWEWRRRKK